MKINSISASRQKTYELCKYKYVLNYCIYECKSCTKLVYDVEFIIPKQCPHCKSNEISKLETKSNFGAEHGTGLHWVLECYANAIRGSLEDGTKLSPKDIKWMIDWRKNIDNVWKKGPKFKDDPNYQLISFAKANEDPKELKLKSVELVEGYLNRQGHIYKKDLILGVEAEFEINLGEIDVHGSQMVAKGFMDYVYKIDDESIEMIDYKFGKKTQNYDEVFADTQSKIYSMALRHIYPGYKNYYLTFDYMREKPITVCYTDDDGEQTKKHLIDAWKRIAEPNQRIDRNVGWHCNAFCVGKDTCNKLWADFQSKFGRK